MNENIIFISPVELYNLLNQEKLGVPCVTDEYYLLLFDSRKLTEYSQSHIIKSKHLMYDANQGFMIPKDIDYSSIRNIVLMDNRSVSANDVTSSAVICAEQLWDLGSKYPVKVVKGGYEEFSKHYPFLRTIKILYTQNEIEQIKLWPYEIENDFLYMGVSKHACDQDIAKHLKVKAHVNVTLKVDPRFSSDDKIEGKTSEEVPQLLHIPVEDSTDADIKPYFATACSFIDQHHSNDSKTVLVYSDLGISRCVVIVLAYLMNQQKISLKDAINHLLSCHQFICPNRAFINSLLDWEKEVLGNEVTKREDLGFLSYD